jgi:hypothetical protein
MSLVFVLAKDCKKKPSNPGEVLPNVGIPLSKFCGVLEHFVVTANGNKISSCVGQISADYQKIVDDACAAHQESVRFYYPAWQTHACDILLLEKDGTLTTIPNYPRDFLTVGGIVTAGTVMFGTNRSIIVLPYYVHPNPHFQFHSAYNEDDHFEGFLNRFNNPVNEWRNYLGANDVHPQKPYIEKSLPDYAKTFPSLTDQNLSDGLKETKPIELNAEQSKAFFDALDKAQSDFNQK